MAGSGGATVLPVRARMLLVAVLVATLVPLVLFPQASTLATVAAAALVVVQAAALWLLAAAPARATAVVIGAGAVIVLLVPGVGFGIAAVAVCSLAWLRPPRVSLWALAALLVLTALDGWLARPWSEALLWAAGAALAWTVGELGRVTTARRLDETRRAVLEERARISRELHDVLAHTVSVMVVQAGAADDVFDVAPEKARAAVRAVEAAGVRAQAELRQLLQAVRDPGEDSGDADGLAPQPGFADLDRLAATVRETGLDVRVSLDAPAAAPAGVQLSVYRIVQESLTNTVRHARAAHADVTVRASAGLVLVEVLDDGRAGEAGGRAGGRAGSGLVGMRERAEQLGGTCETGPAPEGGFRVRARLPLAGPA